MTICEVFVGDLDDPSFKWDGGNWNKNIPARLSPVFPPLPGNYNRVYDEWVAAAGVPSKQTDFGGHVAKVTRSQIIEFITKSYKTHGSSNTDPMLIGLLKFIEKLDANRVYGLVATEW